jgi:Tfp pilus assembly protein PilX
MSRVPRLLRAEQGIALITVMMAIFIMTVMVAALAIASMGESTLSFDHLRGQQALAVAEAGAHRALAELRRRISVDIDTQIGAASQTNPANAETLVRDICQELGSPARKQVEIITVFANPTSWMVSDWTLTGPSGDTAVLTIGSSGSPVQMTDAGTGAVLGDFYAVIAVRSSGAPATCQFGVNVPEQEVMWFDYAILSVGRSNNATRAVCLRSASADRCPDWFPTATATPDGSYTLSGGSSSGWQVLIEKASYSRWALGLLNVGSVWLFTGTTINGPVHSNTELRIAGDPVLNDVVTQVNTDMRLSNCDPGSGGVTIPIPPSDPNGTLRVPGCDNTTGSVFQSSVAGGVSPMLPPSNAVPSRTSIGLSPAGPNATEAEVRTRTTDPEAAASPLRNGAYVMNNCGTPACGGLYINGSVDAMILSSEGDMQVIRLTVNSDPDPLRRNMKIVIDPATKAVTTCWPMDPSTGECSGPVVTRSYGPNTFNGVVYVNGAILSTLDGASKGLYGMVNRQMRMTIAAEGEIRITADLVYEAPPAGPGHNPTNVLGLYSVTGNVTIHGQVAPDNLYVDAVILAPNGRYWVEEWDTLPVKGTLYTLGGSIQGTFGAFGGFMPFTGYGRLMTYDWRLRANVSPPFFPLTETYTAVRYPSPSPWFVDGDPLYDRPQWEEMVGL